MGRQWRGRGRNQRIRIHLRALSSSIRGAERLKADHDVQFTFDGFIFVFGFGAHCQGKAAIDSFTTISESADDFSSIKKNLSFKIVCAKLILVPTFNEKIGVGVYPFIGKICIPHRMKAFFHDFGLIFFGFRVGNSIKPCEGRIRIAQAIRVFGSQALCAYQSDCE